MKLIGAPLPSIHCRRRYWIGLSHAHREKRLFSRPHPTLRRAPSAANSIRLLERSIGQKHGEYDLGINE
ncbi:hypothetical protein GHT06_021107 [Daphnia sinensis]|uniref:Uncharacterized protein n=1 Tax=Daphnia sinensis TaxID=1820382 RepID=A0AAD5KIM1_9CRUS|nr:hypothetical protein GHT06_021107 [Daphnia sinensis]